MAVDGDRWLIDRSRCQEMADVGREPEADTLIPDATQRPSIYRGSGLAHRAAPKGLSSLSRDPTPSYERGRDSGCQSVLLRTIPHCPRTGLLKATWLSRSGFPVLWTGS